MSSIAKNTFYNLLGRIGALVINLTCIPFYIHSLGIEPYGLIGFFNTIFFMLSTFDFGIAIALNKQLAQLSTEQAQNRTTGNFFVTLEKTHWAIGLFMGLCIASLAPFLSKHWIHAEALGVKDVMHSILLMAGIIAVHWPFNFYLNGLMGLERHKEANLILLLGTLLRCVGAIVCLQYRDNSIQMYFLWHWVSCFLQTSASAYLLRKRLGIKHQKPFFEVSHLHQIRKFATGMLGISISGVLLISLDKVILSKILPLSSFSYYALASSIASAIACTVQPLFSAFFPRFSKLAKHNDPKELSHTYHYGCQIMAALFLPMALIVVLFSQELLLLWTQNPTLAKQTHTILTVLSLGTVMNSFVTLPFALQLAHGWTRLTFYQNLIGVLILVPSIILSTLYFGPKGPPWCWLLLNVGYLTISIPLMHKRFLKGELFTWYRQALIFPLIICLCLGLFFKSIYSFDNSRYDLLKLASIAICTLTALLFALPKLRMHLKTYWRNKKVQPL